MCVDETYDSWKLFACNMSWVETKIDSVLAKDGNEYRQQEIIMDQWDYVK
jgi:hypothetical protein